MAPQQPSAMYCLVADYFVTMKIDCIGDTCSFRLQKYIDVSGLRNPHICISHDSAVSLRRNALSNVIINPYMIEYREHHIIHKLVKEGILVGLEISNITGIGTNLKTSDMSVHDMLRHTMRYIKPSMYVNVEQYYCSRHNQPSINDSNRKYYEEFKAKTITITEFLDEFNNAGNKNINSIHENNERIVMLSRELDNTKSTLKETTEALAKDVEEKEQNNKELIASVYIDLEDTMVKLQLATQENLELKREVDTLKQAMVTMMKDIAYLKTVSPMISM